MNWPGEYVAPAYVAVTDASVMTGAMAFRSGAWVLSPSAATSFSESCDTELWVPLVARPPPPPPPKPPPPKPPRVRNTTSVFVPNPSIRFWTATDEPLPTATSTITDPTPMRMPSIVNAERNRLADRPCRAMRVLSRRFIDAGSGAGPRSASGTRR